MDDTHDELSPEERRVQDEIERQAADGHHDEQTVREAVELGLMDAGRSKEGEQIGEHVD